MVLESILYPLKAEKKPWEMFFMGIVYSSIAIFLSLWIFKEQASLIMVFLIVMACVPIVYNTIKLEESKDLKINKERVLLKEHNKAITFLIFLFIGVAVSSMFWYTVLPSSTTRYLFDRQTQTITSINQQVSGDTIQKFNTFTKIMLNNIKVLTFATLFAFIYGAGAIFILTWNATVIGTAIGIFVRSNLSDYATTIGFAKVGSYFHVISYGLLKYALHGIPEIAAYFYGGLAGGIISVALIKHHFSTKNFGNILKDASDLLIISIFFLLIAAFIEAYLTPMLF